MNESIRVLPDFSNFPDLVRHNLETDIENPGD